MHSADNPQSAPERQEGKKISQLRVLAEEMQEPRDSDSEFLDFKGSRTQRKDEVKYPGHGAQSSKLSIRFHSRVETPSPLDPPHKADLLLSSGAVRTARAGHARSFSQELQVP